MERPDNRLGAERRLIEKARTDLEFRRRLLANPNATASAELGIGLPDDITLHVVEEGVIGHGDEAQLHYWLVLPAQPQRAMHKDFIW